MHYSTVLATAVSVLATANAPAACPAVWTQIGLSLQELWFDNSTGQCNDGARLAIRAAFHDCAAWNTSLGFTGGCDGSLILNEVELTRQENDGLQNISAFYTNFLAGFDNAVGMADLIQFGGSTAIKTCPLGPTVTTFVGRTDWTSADPQSPEGLVPNVNASSTSLIELFENKNISAAQLAALVGAHSTARQFASFPAEFDGVDILGEPQDQTPGIWDVDFYNDTLNRPAGVFVFPSDTALMNDPVSGPIFKGFVGKQGKWDGAFANAMLALSLSGLDGSAGLIDCTASLPPSSPVPVTNTARSFSFSAPRAFEGHQLARDGYKNYHKW